MKRIITGFICLFCLISMTGCVGKIEIYHDISRYREVMSFESENADAKWYKWGMDESIWPRQINDASQVSDFTMIYYNPWDAQYLGYLVIDYSADDYAAEVNRLKNYPSTDYIGYYDVRKEEAYELLAVNADEYYGFVYALTDGKNRIIYAEQIFCNYFMDLDYEKYIPADYLLNGFNAKAGNPYRKRMMNE